MVRYRQTPDAPAMLADQGGAWVKWEDVKALLNPTRYDPEILRAHAEFGGDLEDMQRRYDAGQEGLLR